MFESHFCLFFILFYFFSNLKYPNIYIYIFQYNVDFIEDLLCVSFFFFTGFFLKFYFKRNLLHGYLQLEYDVII